MKHEYAYLIQENAVKFILKPKSSGGYADNGRKKPSIPTDPIEKEGVILPLSNHDLQYGANGTFNRQDKKLIVTEPIELKSTIIYRDLEYLVDEAADWDEYSDFYIYLCRRGGK